MELFFKVVNNQEKFWSVESDDERIQMKIMEFNPQENEIIILNYAKAIIQKLRRISGCRGAQE